MEISITDIQRKLNFDYVKARKVRDYIFEKLNEQQDAVTEIFVEHSADGIKNYNSEAFTNLKQQLREKLISLHKMNFDLKVKDVITVYLDKDPYFYKIKNRTIDITDKLYITYWVADL